MKRLSVLFIGLVSFAFIAKDKPVAELLNSYSAWCKENKSKLELVNYKSDLIYQLNYMLPEDAVISEIYADEKINEQTYKALLKKYSVYDEYSLKIYASELKDFLLQMSEDKDDYMAKQNYLQGEVFKDFKMVNDLDTVSPLKVTYVYNFNHTPYLNLHLVFSKDKKLPKEKKLIFNDQLFVGDTLIFNLKNMLTINTPKFF